MRKLIFIIPLVLIILAVLIGMYVKKSFEEPAEEISIKKSVKEFQQGWKFPGGEITVEFVTSFYKAAERKTSGFFKTGQKADLMLSGIDFNNAGGPLLFNHPGGIATDGRSLLLADRNNNRILIWNRLPKGNVPPDFVLGQKDFITNNPGVKLNELNWPVAVATDGKHIVVADTENDRILIWNDFPAENGKSADLVLNGVKGELLDAHGSIRWPWAVWTDGEKLIVASTGARQVLIWNSFPAENNQSADIILQLDEFGTPRSIGSDGKHLIIGDHNALGDLQGNFFWKSFPVSNNQTYDFFIKAGLRDIAPPLPPVSGVPAPEPVAQGEVFWSPIFTSDGKLLAFGNQVYVWNSFPQDKSDAPDLIVGITGPGEQGYFFNGGDGSGMALVDNRLYLSLSNGNKIVGFNSLPMRSDQLPDFAIGSPDIFTNTLETNFIISNPVPASNGENLFVSSDFDSKLYVWKELPDQSGAHPDIVYSLPDAPWDNTLFGQNLILAGKRTVFVWKKLPLTGELPDVIFKDKIGDVYFEELKGVALDENYFYLADWLANKVYVWEGLPEQDSKPKFSLAVDQPWRISTDGKYLAVTNIFNHKILLYEVEHLSSTSSPIAVGGVGKFNLPEVAIVSHGRLFVSDSGFNRVVIWEQIEDALLGKEQDVVLGATVDLDRPEIGADKLFFPAGLSFDGNYLWAGEFKFSERILRFSPQL